MKYNYITIYNDFFTKQISFNDFQSRIDEYLKTVNPGELTLFHHHITDDSFIEYDPDMVMLTYLYLWMLPNRLNQQSQLVGADNMYLSFIKSIRDTYEEEFKKPIEILKNNFTYQIYKRGNLLIIFNISDFDISIDTPDCVKNGVHFCINCGDEIEVGEKLELYPYGFYIIEI